MIRVSLSREAVNGFREAVWPSRWMYPPTGFQPCATVRLAVVCERSGIRNRWSPERDRIAPACTGPV